MYKYDNKHAIYRHFVSLTRNFSAKTTAQITMPNTTLDKAIAAVPKFRDRISLFTKKLRLRQYSDCCIYVHHLKIAQAQLSIIIHHSSLILNNPSHRLQICVHLCKSVVYKNPAQTSRVYTLYSLSTNQAIPIAQPLTSSIL